MRVFLLVLALLLLGGATAASAAGDGAAHDCGTACAASLQDDPADPTCDGEPGCATHAGGCTAHCVAALAVTDPVLLPAVSRAGHLPDGADARVEAPSGRLLRPPIPA
ncbi:MAG: hypothetical protein R3298_11620 [Gammaproteobacteria bacterium]|nr:hypothetical protein [Gammaproteobacteria bacterium]